MDKTNRVELGNWIKKEYFKIDKIKADNGAEQLFKSGKLAGLKHVFKEFCKDEELNEN